MMIIYYTLQENNTQTARMNKTSSTSWKREHHSGIPFWLVFRFDFDLLGRLLTNARTIRSNGKNGEYKRNGSIIHNIGCKSRAVTVMG